MVLGSKGTFPTAGSQSFWHRDSTRQISVTPMLWEEEKSSLIPAQRNKRLKGLREPSTGVLQTCFRVGRQMQARSLNRGLATLQRWVHTCRPQRGSC